MNRAGLESREEWRVVVLLIESVKYFINIVFIDEGCKVHGSLENQVRTSENYDGQTPIGWHRLDLLLLDHK